MKKVPLSRGITNELKIAQIRDLSNQRAKAPLGEPNRGTIAESEALRGAIFTVHGKHTEKQP